MENNEFALSDELNDALAEAPAEVQAPKKFIDPEDDRANWPVIQLDFEEGKPNYEFISVSGTKKNGAPFTHDLQVQRGVDVPVPPSVVNMLRSTKQTAYRQQVNPQDPMKKIMIATDKPPLPWHLVEKGPYIK